MFIQIGQVRNSGLQGYFCRQQSGHCAAAGKLPGGPAGLQQRAGVPDLLAKDFSPPMAVGVSLFLYRIYPNGTHRNPRGRPGPQGEQFRNQLPLDLHFILTAPAHDASLQHLIAGEVTRMFQALNATSTTLRDFLQTSIDAEPFFGAAANPRTNRAMRIRLQTPAEVTRNNGQGACRSGCTGMKSGSTIPRAAFHRINCRLHRCRCGCTTSPRRSRTVRTKAILTPSNTSSARCSNRSIPGPCSREASTSARVRQISSFRRFDPLRSRGGSRMRIDPMPASHAAAERADEHLS
jgi:hypothetical protein